MLVLKTNAPPYGSSIMAGIDSNHYSMARVNARGFTLLELLAAVLILVVLAGILAPAISSVRKAANRSTCARNLSEIGRGFACYSAEFRGYWPAARYDYAQPGDADVPQNWVLSKGWYDYISRYVGPSINDSGMTRAAIDARKSELAVLWGCPNIVSGSGQSPGYGMNAWPRAGGSGLAPLATGNKKYHAVRFGLILPPNGITGGFFKAVDWTKPSERILVADSATPTIAITRWPYWSFADPVPTEPDAQSYSLDFTRHTSLGSRRADSEQARINALFCDGHVAALSAANGYQAIRFAELRR